MMKLLRPDMTVLTACFDQDTLVDCMYRSLLKQLGAYLPLVVISTGTRNYSPASLKEYITCVDDTRHKITLPEGCDEALSGATRASGSNMHAISIDHAMRHIIKTRYCLLVDSDVLFKPKVKGLLSTGIAHDIVGQMGWTTNRAWRILPFFCIIDLEKMKERKIKYYDYKRGYSNGVTKAPPRDTGSSFTEDALHKENLSFKYVMLDNYVVHLGAASYKRKPQIPEWLEGNSALWR